MYASVSLSEHGCEAAAAIAPLTAAGLRASGAVQISCASRGGGSIRHHVREEGSFRIRFPREHTAGLTGVLVNTAGGMTGGDCFSMAATAGQGSMLILTTSAAEKIYRSLAGVARLDVRLVAAENASLAWLPQESIVFDRARIVRSYDVSLAANASFLACDVNCVGRSAMGESVDMLYLNDRWRLWRDGELAFADAMRIDGEAQRILARPFTANGARCFATLVYAANDAAEAVAIVRAVLRGVQAIEAGAGLVNGVCVARLVAADVAPLRATIADCVGAIAQTQMPRSWNT